MMTSIRDLLVVFFVALVPPLLNADRILMLPFQARSHLSTFSILGNELINCYGHEVFMLRNKKYRVPQTLDLGKIKSLYYNDLKPGEEVGEEGVGAYEHTMEEARRECVRMLSDEIAFKRLQVLQFNMVLVDAIFIQRCAYLIPHRLATPYISITDTLDSWAMRVPAPSSFVPCAFSTYTHIMTFTQRLQNMVTRLYFTYVLQPSALPDELLARYTSGEGDDFDSFDGLASRSELWLYTSNEYLDYPEPNMPHVIKVGGLATSPARPLSEELLKFVQDSSSQGTVVVSLGVPQKLQIDFVQRLASTFRMFPQFRFIWRLQEDLKNVTFPQNVRPVHWLPQNDLLGHHKTRLLISNCGRSSLYEALYHGVPVLGFPLMGDHAANAMKIKHHGYGRFLSSPASASVDELANVTRELLTPQPNQYKAAITRASAAFKHSLQTPRERAAYWIDHVIKHGGGAYRPTSMSV